MSASERIAAGRSRRIRLLRSVGWALGFAAALVVLYVAAVATPVGQAVDVRSLGQSIWRGAMAEAAFSAMRTGIPLLLGLCAAAAVAVGMMRRRWVDVACSAVGVLLVVVATAPLRDLVFARPFYGDFGYVANSYPSRHVAVGLVLALVIVRLWPFPAGLGIARVAAALLIAALAEASVATFAHRASDVIGAVFVVGVVAPVVARGTMPHARDALLRRPAVAATMLGTAVVCVALVFVPGAAVPAYSVLVPVAVGGASAVVFRIAVPDRVDFPTGRT